MDLKSPKTILIVQIGKIGDMILTTPLFSEIKKIYPDTKLIVLASQINKDIPLNHNSVDEVIVYKKNILWNLFLLNSSLKKIHLWIDTKNNYSRTSELLLKIFKPGKSLGFNFDKKVFDESLNEYQVGNHSVDINLSPINFIRGTKEKITSKPEFQIPESVKAKAESTLRKNPYLKKVVINFSAGDKSRYLQTGKWTDVINTIFHSHLYCFYIIGLEKDIEEIDSILKETKRSNTKFIRTKDIIETAEIIRRSDIVITPDTSVVHISSAFNKPVIALYPDVKWNLEKFAPLSDRSEVIISGKNNSIDDITAKEIIERFKDLVDKI